MRIFLTGATGFIGSRVIPELLQAGHQVLGMTRSDAGAEALRAAGAEVHRGELEDPASVQAGAAQADAVIHTAFDHDFSNFAANCEKDARVIRAMGEALKGSNRPLLITSGTGIGSKGPGQLATEDVFNTAHANPRIATELTGAELLEQGIAVSVVRLPQVHDTQRQGLITPLVEIFRNKGVATYVGDGQNRWPAAHVSDVARLYRLAIEKCTPGSRYNAVDEEGITTRAIVEVLGEGLGIPVTSIAADEAAGFYGWMGGFVGMDLSASSAWTRQALDWHPTGPSMLDDLRNMDYSRRA